MRDVIALLRTLVLPSGATSGQRIILDGDNGLILVYDSSSNLRERIGFSGAIEIFSGDPNEILGGDLQANISGAGNPRVLVLTIESPGFPARTRSAVDLISQSFDGTVLPMIAYTADSHEFSGISGDADLKLNGVSLPRGYIDSNEKATNTDISAGGTCATVTVTTVAGRRYRLTAGWWRITTTVTNSVTSMAIDESGGSTFKSQRQLLTSAALFGAGGTIVTQITPSAGSHTYRLQGSTVSGGGTNTVAAAAGAESYIIVEDIGV